MLIAGHYADGPGGSEVGYARLDRGVEFVYHAVRLSRGARLGDTETALARARSVWAGPPAVASDVQLVYQDGAFVVPVPPGGTEPAPDNRVAEPRSRLGWVVRGSVTRRAAADDRPARLRLGPGRLEHPAPAAGDAVSDLRRRRLGRRRRAHRKRQNIAFIICGMLAAVVGGFVLVSALAIHSVGESLDGGELKEIRLGQNTRIYDKDKNLLGIVAGETNRTVVASNRIPQVLKDATVAIEDKRFYSHDGVNYYRLAGAAVRDLQSGSANQGGSTITMQLIKNLYDPQAGRTLSKKIEEAYLAYQYEKRYTKDEILARYLNGVFYGQNAVGRAGGIADLLRQGRLEGHAAPGRAAGGPARRRRPRTTRSATPRRRASGATWCSTRWPTRATSPRSAPTRPRWPASG